MYINPSGVGGCQEQEAYDSGNNISLRKTCFLCLDANQGTIGQSSLADQGQGGMEVSCHHVFEEEEFKKKKWRDELKSVDRIFALRAPPEVKGVALQSEQQIGSN